MKHHYTFIGNSGIPVVLEYIYHPRSRVYDEEDGTYETLNPCAQILDVFIDGVRARGTRSFADWQISAWEREIMQSNDSPKSSGWVFEE